MISNNSVVVIGAGHNGLVCAAYLAKAGVKVCGVDPAAFIPELYGGS